MFVPWTDTPCQPLCLRFDCVPRQTRGCAQSDTIVGVPEAKHSAETLKRVPIFSGLSQPELAFLGQRTVPRRFSAGETVFSEGEPCTGLYVVESGHVRIFKSSPGGREHVLAIEGPGSSVAELPVFDGGNYPASVSAVDEATLLFVSKQDFQALCLEHPQVALKVLRVVGARLRRLVGIIEELSFTTVRHRLAAFLVRLAKTSGTRSAIGLDVTLPANNQELASQIGTVRELISRNLSRFQAEGMIKIEGRNVSITDMKALEAELQSAE
ncbi:MAG TPA: Crp/Fnr family transcriptional regulator [Terriglobales bacterium]|nr:Crp/Fnr family transcriptional regulator [Terriglobales bacterium]